MTFHSNMKITAQVDIIENFRNRRIKILVCTDALRIDMNIRNIYI